MTPTCAPTEWKLAISEVAQESSRAVAIAQEKIGRSVAVEVTDRHPHRMRLDEAIEHAELATLLAISIDIPPAAHRPADQHVLELGEGQRWRLAALEVGPRIRVASVVDRAGLSRTLSVSIIIGRRRGHMRTRTNGRRIAHTGSHDEGCEPPEPAHRHHLGIFEDGLAICHPGPRRNQSDVRLVPTPRGKPPRATQLPVRAPHRWLRDRYSIVALLARDGLRASFAPGRPAQRSNRSDRPSPSKPRFPEQPQARLGHPCPGRTGAGYWGGRAHRTRCDAGRRSATTRLTTAARAGAASRLAQPPLARRRRHKLPRGRPPARPLPCPHVDPTLVHPRGACACNSTSSATVKRGDAFGRAELVTDDGHQIDTEFIDPYLNLAHRLRGVRVHHDLRVRLAQGLCQLADGLHRPRLVVSQDHRGQVHSAHGFGVEHDPATSVGAQASDAPARRADHQALERHLDRRGARWRS